MKKVIGSRKVLSAVLWLIALHSFFAGLGIIFLPLSVFKYLGFNISAVDFFRYQGGVFHIVMSIAYVWAAVDVEKNSNLILFSITAKFIATVFLFFYYALIAGIWIVLFSGITDFLMGIVLLTLLMKTKNSRERILSAVD